jgi:hypothetical protein
MVGSKAPILAVWILAAVASRSKVSGSSLIGGESGPAAALMREIRLDGLNALRRASHASTSSRAASAADSRWASERPVRTNSKRVRIASNPVRKMGGDSGTWRRGGK